MNDQSQSEASEHHIGREYKERGQTDRQWERNANTGLTLDLWIIRSMTNIGHTADNTDDNNHWQRWSCSRPTGNGNFGRPLGRAVQNALLDGLHVSRVTLFVNTEHIPAFRAHSCL